MRVWSVLTVVVVVAVAGALAVPLQEEDSSYTGSKTVGAIKSWFKPVTDYFSDFHTKTPSDVASDVRDKVKDVQEWAQESDTIQGLRASITPVKTWLKEKANAMSDQSFKEMYESVKGKVADLDETVSTWINRNTE